MPNSHPPPDRSRKHRDLRQGAEGDGRSLVAVAYGWASRVMTICLEMVVPGAAGIWIDEKLGTKVVFTLAGFGLGLTLGIWHLVKLTKPDSGEHE